jgi:hypothetical protein
VPCIRLGHSSIDSELVIATRPCLEAEWLCLARDGADSIALDICASVSDTILYHPATPEELADGTCACALPWPRTAPVAKAILPSKGLSNDGITRSFQGIHFTPPGSAEIVDVTAARRLRLIF